VTLCNLHAEITPSRLIMKLKQAKWRYYGFMNYQGVHLYQCAGLAWVLESMYKGWTQFLSMWCDTSYDYFLICFLSLKQGW
jgi:hypothetical protein